MKKALRKKGLVMVTLIAVIGIGAYAFADGGMGYGGQGYMGKGGMKGHGMKKGGMKGHGMKEGAMKDHGMKEGTMKEGAMMGGDCESQYQKLEKPLGETDVMTKIENYLNSTKNPNLKPGKIEDKGDVFEAEILTKDDSLVDKIIVDKNTGRMRSAY